LFFFFFIQAEDGIRDFHVTGVQTCALPISSTGDEEATTFGYAFDVGVLKKDLFTRHLNFAAVLANIGPSVYYVDKSIEDPIPLKIGRASCRERVEISMDFVSCVLIIYIIII